jgi:hypothetical protein
MIKYPYLKEQHSTRQVIDAFKGYNHNLRIGAGEFYEMENLTSDDYPVLSPRGKRGALSQSLKSCRGMHYVSGTGLFYATITEDGSTWLYLRTVTGVERNITDLDSNSKKFALMGKLLVIVPDMKWVDIDTLATGSMDESWTVKSGTITAQMCDMEGNVYENITVSALPPSSPGYHELWLCNAVGNIGLSQYEPSTSEWISIPSTYVKITGLGGHYFNTYDGVQISGFNGTAPQLNGSHVLQYAGHGDVVIPGIIYEECTQDCGSNPITIERKVPKLDFAVEAGNRLWGCIKDTNEIYACKLGDIFNWNCFQGLSTDSWVGSVGTPGEFTGAAVQNGYPIFYKENCKHKVWPSSTGAHQITSTVCEGVEKDSDSSIAVLDGTVFYKSPVGICADDGGGITMIGENLGDIHYRYACGAIYDRKYYLNMLDSRYRRHLFIYDIARGLWHVEDGPDDRHLAAGIGCLYSVSGNNLLDLTGKTGTLEENVSWMAVTGDLGLELPEQKYISRLTLRLTLEPGAKLEIFAMYDREPVWISLGTVYGTDLRSFSLPVRPRRCDQLRLKLQGQGMCKIYSIAKTLEMGSELT